MAAPLLVAPGGALAAWPSDSTTNLPVCVAPNSQESADITSDGLGGAFITWRDNRSSTFQAQIYAQRVTASGAIATGWPANGALVCTTSVNQYSPGIVQDGVGDAIIAWNAYSRHVLAQRVNADGNLLWPLAGIVLSATSRANDYRPAMAADGLGGAIIAWMDGYNAGSHGYDVYAQHITNDGSLLWGANGLAIATRPFTHISVDVAADGSGGAFLAWDDAPNGTNDIWAQHVTSEGAKLWGPDGVAVSSAALQQLSPHLCPDGAGGAFVGWEDFRSEPIGDAYGHHLLPGGVDPAWPADGLVLAADQGVIQGEALPVADGDSGAIFAWTDGRGGAYAQRVTRSGTALWAPGGVLAGGSGALSDAISDSAGGLIVAIRGNQNGGPSNAYAQRINGAGLRQWGPPKRIAVSTAPQFQNLIRATADGAHGAILVWHDSRSDTGDVYAQNVNADGSLGGDIVAAQLALVSADVRPGLVALKWLSPDGAKTLATLYRTTDESDWTELATLTADGEGMLSYEDRTITAGERYGYRLGVWSNGREEFTSIAWVEVPTEFALGLEAPKPNPTPGAIRFRFTLPSATEVRLGVYDPAGRLVRLLARERFDAGEHTMSWDAADNAGRHVSAGVYFIRLEAFGRTLSRRAAVIR